MEKINYKKLYNEAYDILKDIAKNAGKGILEEELRKKYLECKRPKSLKEVFDIMVGSAQNSGRMSKTIKYSGNNNKYKDYKKLLFDFNFALVYKKFNGKEKELSKEIKKICKSDGQKFCDNFANSIIDSANFLSEFKTMKDFEKFLENFNLNIHTRLALPLLLKEKIRGFGFALACNFLKEIGCTYYSKPDIHIKEVCKNLKLSNFNDINAFLAIDKWATMCKKTPYEIDKIIWLICSGKFYNHLNDKGEELKVKGERDYLIKRLKLINK